MDCEKLDAMAMDLVDPDGAGEIDALRAQQAEEHLAGCARCTALVARLRKGLGAARELELEDVPSLLESRILAAAAIAKPLPSWPRRVSRVVSTAGSWAMRPQVAMAAVLVVMLGMSAILLRGGLPSRRTKVTDEGTPVATLEPASPEGAGAPAVIGGEKLADGEKGESKAKAKEAPHPAAPAPKAESAPADLPAAKPVEEQEYDKADKSPPKKLAEKAKGGFGDDDFGGLAADGKAATGNVAPGGTKAPSSPAQQAPAAGPMPAPTAAAPPPPAKPAGVAAEDAKKDLEKSEGKATTTSASFDDAMTAYKEKRWGAAAQGFDAAAAAGNKPSMSTLYAARSYRAAGSCAQALPRFQKVVATWPSSADAPYAALEGGQCAKALGDIPTARALFLKAKAYPATQKSAEAELALLDKPPMTAPKAMKPATSDSY